MFRLKRAAQAAALVLIAGCTGDAGKLVGPSEGPSSVISDAAHAGAVPGFYFLPPMVPQPSYSGTFDGGLTPRVEICELSGASCGSTIATFSFGTGSTSVRVSAADQHYIVNWHTGSYNLDTSKTYRISVYQGTFLLGFADVDVVGTAKELKNVNTQQFIPLLDDRTLPIKFRVETGIVAQVVVAPPVDTVNVGETSQFTATLIDLHGNPVAGPSVAWSSSAPAVATIDANGLATGVAPGTATITASLGYVSGTATLVVEQPNQPPVASADTFQAIGNVTVPVSAPGLLANDTDPDANSLSVTAGSVPTTAGGTVVLNADGSFAYLSAPGFIGTDSFSYEISDGIATATATVTVQVATRVWYVGAAASGDGRDASPFGTLAEAEGASAAGETIFLLAGSHGTGITLKNDQSLTGQGVAANVTASLNGETVVLLAAGGTPSVGGTIQLAQDNTVQGLNVASTAGAGIAGSGIGTFVAALVSVSAQGGPALDLASGNVAAAFGTVSSSNSAGAGLDLSGLSGSLTASGGSITGAAGAGVLIAGGNGTIDYAGDVSGSGAGAAQVSGRTGGSVTLSGAIVDSGSGIVVQNNTGGTIAFTGPSKALSTGAGNGVTLANNGGASVTFGGGGLAIATTTGTGFSATGGGTVTVTGANNTASTTGGRAVNVANTAIGASGITFRSVSASGGISAIVLTNTGAVNGFQVTGDGSLTQNASGGTITGTTGDAVVASGVTGLVLRSMNLESPSGDAVDVSGSSGVALVAMKIFRPGASGVVATELSGSNRIEKSLVDYDNTSVAGSAAVRVENTAVSGSFLLDGTTVRNKLDGGAAVVVSARGGANVAFTVRDSDAGDGFESLYTNLFGSAIVVGSGDSPGSTAHVTARVTDTRFVNAAPNGVNNLELSARQGAVLDFVVRGNLFDAVGRPLATVGVVNVNATEQGRIGSTTAADSISGNTFQNLGTSAAQGYLGVRVAVDNPVAGIDHKVVIAGNTFLNIWRQAILVSSRANADDVNVRIVDNVIGTAAAPVARGNRRGVELEAQSSSALKVEVLDNSLVNTSTSGTNSALQIRSIGSTSAVSATVLGNTIGNTNGAVTAGRFRAETQAGTTATMCLDLRNNSLDDASRLFEAFASGTGLFSVEGPGAAVVTGADLTALNTVGTGSVSGSPTFNNNTNCVQPSL